MFNLNLCPFISQQLDTLYAIICYIKVPFSHLSFFHVVKLPFKLFFETNWHSSASPTDDYGLSLHYSGAWVLFLLLLLGWHEE